MHHPQLPLPSSLRRSLTRGLERALASLADTLDLTGELSSFRLDLRPEDVDDDLRYGRS